MIFERAQELGRLVGQSGEYKALQRARERLGEEPELKTNLDRLRDLSELLERMAAQGQEPTPEQVNEYDSLLGTIQSSALYQGVVAAQANFDKMMLRVNEQILDGMKKGSASSIITLG